VTCPNLRETISERGVHFAEVVYISILRAAREISRGGYYNATIYYCNRCNHKTRACTFSGRVFRQRQSQTKKKKTILYFISKVEVLQWYRYIISRLWFPALTYYTNIHEIDNILPVICDSTFGGGNIFIPSLRLGKKNSSIVAYRVVYFLVYLNTVLCTFYREIVNLKIEKMLNAKKK